MKPRCVWVGLVCDGAVCAWACLGLMRCLVAPLFENKNITTKRFIATAEGACLRHNRRAAVPATVAVYECATWFSGRHGLDADIVGMLRLHDNLKSPVSRAFRLNPGIVAPLPLIGFDILLTRGVENRPNKKDSLLIRALGVRR